VGRRREGKERVGGKKKKWAPLEDDADSDVGARSDKVVKSSSSSEEEVRELWWGGCIFQSSATSGGRRRGRDPNSSVMGGESW